MSKLTGEIRQLRWGIIPTEPTFIIKAGQHVGLNKSLLVVSIHKEFINAGENEFHIECVEVNGSGKPKVGSKSFMWKTYTLKPDEIQYFTPSETHDYLKV